MNLIEALEELKKGKKIRRKKWNNKERYICYKKGCLRTNTGDIKHGVCILTPSELTDDNWELYNDKKNRETQYKIDSMKFQILRYCDDCAECKIAEVCGRYEGTLWSNALDNWSLKEIVEAYHTLKKAGEI